MIQQKRVREALKKGAEETGIPFPVFEKIYESPFQLLKKCMEAGVRGNPSSFKGVQILGLGKFISKPGRHKYYKNGGNTTEETNPNS